MTPYSSESASVVSGTTPSASKRVPRWTSRVASPPSSSSMFGPTTSPEESRNSNRRWVHHQYSGRVSPFQAKTGTPAGSSGVPSPTTIAAAAWSWVEKMLQLTQRTSAPSAFSVSMRTAVWMVMCSEPAMRAPASGCSAPNSSRRAMSPGISCSASEISLRPKAARERSATLKSASPVGVVSTRVPVLAVMSLQGSTRPTADRVRGSAEWRASMPRLRRGSCRRPEYDPAGSASRRRSRIGDANDDLLVVDRVRLVGEGRADPGDELLPGAELVVLPARVVEELVEDQHRADLETGRHGVEHRHRRRVEVAVDVDEVHGAGVLGEEPGQRLVEPPDHELRAGDLRQLVDGEGPLADVRAVVLGQALEGV